jgi:hypothetical protein
MITLRAGQFADGFSHLQSTGLMIVMFIVCARVTQNPVSPTALGNYFHAFARSRRLAIHALKGGIKS